MCKLGCLDTLKTQKNLLFVFVLLFTSKIKIHGIVILRLISYGCETWLTHTHTHTKSLSLSLSCIEGVSIQGAKENIWSQEEGSGRRLEKTT